MYETLDLIEYVYLESEFKQAELIHEVDEKLLATTNAGLLFVTYTNKTSGEEMKRTVCAANFNWLQATSFCQLIGYEQGNWGSGPKKFITE